MADKQPSLQDHFLNAVRRAHTHAGEMSGAGVLDALEHAERIENA